MQLHHKITLCLVFCNLLAQAQTVQPSPAFLKKIAAITASMPATTAGQLDTAMQHITALGETGLTAMAALLPGKPPIDRVKLQYALNSYGAYVTQAALEGTCAAAVKAYSKALPKVTDPESKIFLITQLQRMGNESVVPVLAPYLLNPRFCDAAARALTQINGGAAKVALVKALGKANINCKISMVAALGQLRYLSALDMITTLAASPDLRLRREALHAIALIGSAGSAPVMMAAAEKVHYGTEPTNATASCLLYAQQLAFNWPQQPAFEIARQLLQRCNGDSLMHIRIAAMELIAYIRGDEAIPMLQTAVISGPLPYRAAALRIAAKHMNETTTGLWVMKAKLVKGAPEAAIITLLGGSRQRAALPVCIAALQDSDAVVKLAAIDALGSLGDREILSPLMTALKTSDTTAINAITTVLLTVKGSDLTERIATSLGQEPPAAQIALLQVLATRKADNALPQLLQLFRQHNPPVQQAVLTTLDKIGGTSLLQKAAGQLREADSVMIQQYIGLHHP